MERTLGVPDHLKLCLVNQQTPLKNVWNILHLSMSMYAISINIYKGPLSVRISWIYPRNPEDLTPYHCKIRVDS